MSHSGRSYVPAAGRHWQLPFYDLLARLLGAGPARRILVRQAQIRPGERVLEVGAGTGSLAVALAQAYPGAAVHALDPDPRALAIARRKAAAASVSVTFAEGFADALPYADASFDRVTSSLMFHHLPRSGRVPALREMLRVLKPGGSLHLLDMDGPLGDAAAPVARRIHASAPLRENSPERVLAQMAEAGFHAPAVVHRRTTRITHMVYYRAFAPVPGRGGQDASAHAAMASAVR